MRSLLAPVLKLAVFTTVTVLLTGVLAITLAGTSFESHTAYRARLSNVLGLNAGDDVRMSGVKVGSVVSVRTANPRYAVVRFTVEGDRRIAAGATAAIKYRNLIGQRYLELTSGAPEAGQALPPGGMIPLKHTSPALNLTKLFNGFKPLFRAVQPEDVNELSQGIIRILQGQGGTVDSLLAHVGSLTSTLANRTAVIDKVINNLTTVLDTVNSHGDRFSDLIATMQKLVSGLAEQRKPIGEATEALGLLADSTAGLLSRARPPLKQGVANLRQLSSNLNDSSQLVEQFLQTLPRKAKALTRVVSYGSWLNFYLCELTGSIGIDSMNVQVPILPVPTTSSAPRCRP